MKRIRIALVALTVLFSCQNNELEDVVTFDQFSATVESFDVGSKTSMTPNRQVVWSSGDHIAVFQGSTLADEYELDESCAGKVNALFNLVEDNSPVNGDFIAGSELSYNVAFYPYSEGLSLNGATLENEPSFFIDNVILPSVQYYSPNSFGYATFPMVAVTETISNHSLKFKNILGALKLQFKGNIVVKTIKIEGNNGEKLSGTAIVTVYKDNSDPLIELSADASAEVTLDCGNGVHLSETDATSFIIAIPPMTFQNGFKVKITDLNRRTYTIVADVANEILRSSLLAMPEITIERSGEFSDEDNYVDEYDINHGPGIKIGGTIWAPVNCGYHRTDFPYGKLYQWGRKYGQGYDGDAVIPIVGAGVESLKVAQSEAYKNKFFIDSWSNPHNGALWNSSADDVPVKTKYDPCPSGWRVSTYAELSELAKYRSKWVINEELQSGYYFSYTNADTEETSQIFLPASGDRTASGVCEYRNIRGSYWASKSYNSLGIAYMMYFVSSNVAMSNDNLQVGASVRCVKESGNEDESNEDQVIIPVYSIILNSTELNLYVDESTQLTARVLPVDATDKSLVWSSEDESVAIVDQCGLVTAMSVGETVIYVQAGETVATCFVEVISNPKIDYIDEYGINHGVGIPIGMAIWAPVNCGYHKTDYPYGKLYQWGRKYGQGYEGDATTPEISDGGVSLQGGQLESNKNVFFIPTQDSDSDWIYPHDGNLWNSGSEEFPLKTSYDPCPDGWRVPTETELTELSQNRSDLAVNWHNQNGYWYCGINTYTEDVPQIFLPSAGCRSMDGNVAERGTDGYYWSSKSSLISLSRALWSSNSKRVMYGTGRPNGFAVRCVQDE